MKAPITQEKLDRREDKKNRMGYYQTDKAPVKGRSHVEKVEKELVVQYEREVKAIL